MKSLRICQGLGRITSAAVVGVTLVLGTGAALAQDPTLDQPVSESSIVTGWAEPSSGPITVYDMSYAAPTPLGSGSSMDANGYFAVSVSPLLIEDNQIVARDAAGRESVLTTVIRDPSLPQ